MSEIAAFKKEIIAAVIRDIESRYVLIPKDSPAAENLQLATSNGSTALALVAFEKKVEGLIAASSKAIKSEVISGINKTLVPKINKMVTQIEYNSTMDESMYSYGTEVMRGDSGGNNGVSIAFDDKY